MTISQNKEGWVPAQLQQAIYGGEGLIPYSDVISSHCLARIHSLPMIHIQLRMGWDMLQQHEALQPHCDRATKLA